MQTSRIKHVQSHPVIKHIKHHQKQHKPYCSTFCPSCWPEDWQTARWEIFSRSWSLPNSITDSSCRIRGKMWDPSGGGTPHSVVHQFSPRIPGFGVPRIPGSDGTMETWDPGIPKTHDADWWSGEMLPSGENVFLWSLPWQEHLGYWGVLLHLWIINPKNLQLETCSVCHIAVAHHPIAGAIPSITKPLLEMVYGSLVYTYHI